MEEFLRELELLESVQETISKDNFPFEFQGKGLNNDQPSLQDCQPTNLLVGLGPFGNQDIKAELQSRFLLPKPYSKDFSDKSSRFINREVNLHSLVLFPNASKINTKYELKRNLKTGSFYLGDFKETFVDDETLLATNSTSLKRQPAASNNFVRGKSNYFPFAPGGIQFQMKEKKVNELLEEGNLNQLLDLDTGIITFNSGLLSIPPGFERGIEFDITNSTKVDITKIISGNDNLLLSWIKESKENEDGKLKQDSPKVDNEKLQPKDVDDFLPETDELLTNKPMTKKNIKKREWAHMIDVNQDFPEFSDLVPELAHEFPFELDIFQKRAVYHLEKSESVFVAAHTSAGKTVVAEYAVALAMKHMTRAIYTSPIKALSNQKFRDFKETFEDVGILTGDIQIKPEAACLVMTTEILRSMLYRGADLIRDVEFVIFDEVHYVNDADRGVVWEEVIIMLPAHVTLILLSATVPNTKEFAGWVGRTKQKDIYVISTLKRPVPLEHHLFVGKEIIKIVDSNKNFLQTGYKKAYEVLNPPKKSVAKSDVGRGRGYGRSAPAPTPPRNGGRNSGSATDKNLFVNIVSFLKKKELLPAIIFSFSKKKCEEYAQALTNLDLTSGATEKSKIHMFIEKSLTCLIGSDRQLPQVLRLRELLSRGIAVHHSGLLPILKEIVEILFTRGLVKVLFATETFAMGVNAPARCVVFAMTRKHDGINFRNLLPGEYTQMSGRAGRRGLDSTGMVIIACGDDLPNELDVRTMILGNPTKLESQFRVTYNMILNLLRVEAIKVEDMIKRSFSENETQKGLPEQEELRKQGSKLLQNLEKVNCTFCNKDIDLFYEYSSRILNLGYSMNEKIIKSPLGLKALSVGRIVIINNNMYRNNIGVILGSGKTTITQSAETATRNISSTTLGSHKVSLNEEKSYWVFVLLDRSNQSQNGIIFLISEHTALPITFLQIPKKDSAHHAVECLSYTTFSYVTSKQISINAETILTKHRHSDLEGLKLQLVEVAQEFEAMVVVPEFDWNKLRDLEFQEAYRERTQLLLQLHQFQCYKCPDLNQHYSLIHKERMLKSQLAELEHNLSDLNLDLLPDYHQKVDVLKLLGFVDHESIVQVKGRVACEINTADELILTEMILDNFFGDYEPAEIVALLSIFVFQEKSQSTPVLTPHLEKGIDKIKKLTETIANTQRACGLSVTPSDAVGSLRFGLVEVVYEWARGLPFKYITDLTDVLEGSIVRCIVRLSETCREVSGAARLIGDAALYRKMEEAANLIRRDIVFAASLYF